MIGIFKGLNHYVLDTSKHCFVFSTETSRLRTEIEQYSKDSAQYTQLERKYESLMKAKESLEGQLADYNLALDKVKKIMHTNIASFVL